MEQQSELDLASRIEVLLFAEGGSLPKKKITQILSVGLAEVEGALDELAMRRDGSGLSVVRTELEVALCIAPQAESTIEKAYERELGRDIGDAGLEVLAIILYRGPSTRADVDYIRGVNTSSTIRLLSARGLIERTQNPADAREYLYRPTTELLAYLGVREGKELPNYDTIAHELSTFEATQASDGPFTQHEDQGEASE